MLSALMLALLVFGTPARAQGPLYVSDEVFIVLHAGPGTSYRWLGRLTPGTELSPVDGDSAASAAEDPDQEWQQVTTTRGTTGWVRREFLSRAKPAQARLPELEQDLSTLRQRNQTLQDELQTIRADSAALDEEANTASAELAATQAELAQLKSISGRAVQLDEENRELVQTVETLRTEVDMLQVDNQRLQENLRSSAFIDGALAVLLGVLITLVVPRLWPRRRSSSSWA
jgi:SH3 domain protein